MILAKEEEDDTTALKKERDTFQKKMLKIAGDIDITGMKQLEKVTLLEQFDPQDREKFEAIEQRVQALRNDPEEVIRQAAQCVDSFLCDMKCLEGGGALETYNLNVSAFKSAWKKALKGSRALVTEPEVVDKLTELSQAVKDNVRKAILKKTPSALDTYFHYVKGREPAYVKAISKMNLDTRMVYASPKKSGVIAPLKPKAE